MSVPGTIIALLLGAAFLRAGVPKLMRTPYYRERVTHWRLPEAALPIIGLAEAGGATLLILGAVTQAAAVAVAGGLLVAVTMAGAVLTHFRIGDRLKQAAPALVLGGLAVVDVVSLLGEV